MLTEIKGNVRVERGFHLWLIMTKSQITFSVQHLIERNTKQKKKRDESIE